MRRAAWAVGPAALVLATAAVSQPSGPGTAPDAAASATAPVAGAGSGAAGSADAAREGRRLYVQNCSHCHGFNMVNSGTVSYDLRKFPLEEEDRFLHSVAEGKGTMPAWKGSLSNEQIGKIWAYVQTRGRS